MLNSQSPQEYFRTILLTVVGRAYSAAGYTLDEQPIQWTAGRFRFSKRLDDGLFGFIVYQMLTYTDSEWASGMPSRFQVILVRTDQHNPAADSDHPQFARGSLSQLVVDNFGVPILPSSDHWWAYRSVHELGNALAEAGHLVFGYGIPWLSGELSPPDESDVGNTTDDRG